MTTLVDRVREKLLSELNTSKYSVTEESKSPSQARLMAACAHGATYDSCPPADVAKEFNKADEGGALLSQAMKELVRKS